MKIKKENMKRRNSDFFELIKKRDEAIFRAYKRVISTYPGPLNGVKDIAYVISGENAPRFFVDINRASRVFYMMRRGVKLKFARAERREMYEEIYRRVIDRKKEFPQKSFARILDEVILQPAPSFYLTPKSLYVYLSRILARRKSLICG